MILFSSFQNMQINSFLGLASAHENGLNKATFLKGMLN